MNQKGLKSKEEKIMMRYLQRLGKSLMLPVACLPVAAILQGIVTGSTRLDGGKQCNCSIFIKGRRMV